MFIDGLLRSADGSSLLLLPTIGTKQGERNCFCRKIENEYIFMKVMKIMNIHRKKTISYWKSSFLSEIDKIKDFSYGYKTMDDFSGTK